MGLIWLLFPVKAALALAESERHLRNELHRYEQLEGQLLQRAESAEARCTSLEVSLAAALAEAEQLRSRVRDLEQQAAESAEGHLCELQQLYQHVAGRLIFPLANVRWRRKEKIKTS